jgi:hypothetical protein
MNKKTCHVLGQLQTFVTTNCEKTCSKIHLYEKQNLAKKTCNPFLK